ncbi:head-tail connector protein [Amantichitinum ursilacus]|uniref:Phage gp6-like head-tail connector protein n=1 Tax=Amantichitinum ursilacus TaxID=857265 RepID=A0A0N0GNP3_9NEIS|nr:head-tail connector protein [Amantichitinum ursilacus]KPC53022.1 Phage gp6-like head-tail connector protein [Amantichitinum ursilacus]
MYTRIQAPAEMPVTLDEIKLHCRIDGDDEDALLQGLVAAAYGQAEHRTGRALLPQTWKLVCRIGAAALYGVPLRRDTTEIVSVTWTDAEGNQQLWDASSYWLVAGYRLVARRQWPDTGDMPVTITFRCGAFSGPEDFPESIKAWMKIFAGTLYENREAVQTVELAELPRTFVDGLLDPYVLIEV